MKKTLLSMAALAACLGAQAQHKAPASFEKFGNPGTVSKTTATDSRLIGVTNLNWDGAALEISDSAAMTYPGTDGYGYDGELDTWKFGNAAGYQYDNGMYEEMFRATNTFTTNKRIASTTFEIGMMGIWIPFSWEGYTYTAGNKVATEISAEFDGSDWDSTRQTHTYNAQGAMTASETEIYSYVNGVWEKDNRQTMTYDGSGNLTESKNETWNSSTNQYEPNSRQLMTYAGGRLSVSNGENYQNGVWEPSFRTTYTYDAQGRVTVELSEVYFNGWQPGQRTTTTYSTAGDPIRIEVERHDGNAWENQRETVSTFNAFHQTVTEMSHQWDGSQYAEGPGSFAARYYYQTFENSVKDVAKNGGTLHAYPVPAANVLHLNLQRTVAEAAAGYIYDISGRVVSQFAVPAAKQHVQQIDVTALPAGNYTIKITGANTNLVKQVVVGK